MSKLTDELYNHRCLLFLALMKSNPTISWISTSHHDGTPAGGSDWFIAGMKLPAGQVTYHLPSRDWMTACDTGAKCRPRAPKWDGHTSDDVIKRLRDFIES